MILMGCGVQWLITYMILENNYISNGGVVYNDLIKYMILMGCGIQWFNYIHDTWKHLFQQRGSGVQWFNNIHDTRKKLYQKRGCDVQWFNKILDT